jgi:hypothetical protein
VRAARKITARVRSLTRASPAGLGARRKPWRRRACGLAGLAALVATAAGCQPTRYVGLERSDPEAAVLALPVGGRDPGLRAFYLWGFLPSEQTVDAEAICGAPGIAEVRTERSAGQLFLYALSAGVFAPYTAEVTCGPAATGRAASIAAAEPSDSTAAR